MSANPANQDNPDSPLATRHTSLWFEDGNVVLIAEGVAFKVHRSVLALRSSVFKDMFSFPQPQRQSDSEDTFDGCPAVTLSDQMSHVRIVLDIFYNGIQYLAKREQPSWAIVNAMLVLGRKYQIDDLYSEGVHQLERIYPGDVDVLGQGKAGTDFMSFEHEHMISVANVVQDLDLQHLRAHSLYDCCQLDNSDLVRGVYGEKLREDDLLRCLDARTGLSEARGRVERAMFMSTEHDGCMRCAPILADLRQVDADLRCSSNFHDPLRSHSDLPIAWFNASCERLCVDCAGFHRAQDRAMRQNILDNLLDFIDIAEYGLDDEDE
ncbi:hypothetical protein EIP91_001285 [Steccherinum ochraceum]|uniref:BTB domain-containing protein n=1 Tax=Steccherinum ochraceum TaxID=92696 RepID=A0A4R0RMT6_9APHY|nr:hypothetical protein EIP91_001285 [Steccherinum ochraceum]